MKIIKISVLALSMALLSFDKVPTELSKLNLTLVTSPISWTNDSIDVGTIPQNVPKVIAFEFKNNSKKSLIISTVQGSCGCTATDYPKETIEPGKLAVIKATFNAANVGAFTKTVTVTTSAEATPKILTFKGIVQ